MLEDFDYTPGPTEGIPEPDLHDAAAIFSERAGRELREHPDMMGIGMESSSLKKYLPTSRSSQPVLFDLRSGYTTTGDPLLSLKVFVPEFEEGIEHETRTAHDLALDPEAHIVRRRDTQDIYANPGFSEPELPPQDLIDNTRPGITEVIELVDIPFAEASLSSEDPVFRILARNEETRRLLEEHSRNLKFEEKMGLNNRPVGSEEVTSLLDNFGRAIPYLPRQDLL